MIKSEEKYQYAELLLPLRLEGCFTYFIPDIFRDKIKRGNRVLVNFGKNKLYTGIVFSLHNNVPNFETKEIISILDEEAFLTEKQLRFMQWISEYYCSSLGDVLNASIPDNLIPSSQTKIFFNNDFDTEINITDNEKLIANFIAKKQGTTIEEIINNCKIKNPIAIIKKLEKLNLIFLSQKITNEYKEKKQKKVFFDVNIIENQISEFENITKRQGKQILILNYLIDYCSKNQRNNCLIDIDKILTATATSIDSLKRLAEKNFLEIREISISRLNIYDEEKIFWEKISLSQAQSVAYEEITNNFLIEKPVLLHGVTSSGKTEIYIKLIYDCLKNNKSVLYLLPEIAITTQIINRLQKYFGNEIAVFHSKYPITMRAEVYLELLKKKKKIIIGVRSAIFLPFSDLGLIIVDEEHETTYKQSDPAPRYNARDAALVLAKIHKANIILGSATPSLESYQNTIQKKYALVELTQRYGNVNLPQIIIADTKDGYNRKLMTSHFHPILLQNIKIALDNKEQIILFQNRRGFSQYIECKKCGWVPTCEQCNVSLTYHKNDNKLICHYCGSVYDTIENCEKCKSNSLSYHGIGTEKIEEELQKIFPLAKIKRLDYDTTKTRTSYEKIINDFEKQNIDILVGTQMLSKGLDFENLSLVGIINADNLINAPDFRAFEHAFQMLMQVSGRAGRRTKQGKVVLQTFNSETPVIKYLIKNDYKAFFDEEIKQRKNYNYPPFVRFIEIKLKSQNKGKLIKQTFLLANEFYEIFGKKRLRGPSEPLVNKISNYHILKIHLRFEKNLDINKIKLIIKEKCNTFLKQKENKDIRIDIDIDVA